VIDHFQSKATSVELSDDFKSQAIKLFGRLAREDMDLTSTDLKWTPNIPIGNRIRYSLILNYRPVKEFGTGIGYRSLYYFTDLTVFLQIIVYDNLEGKIVGYASTRGDYVKYAVKDKRCKKMIEYMFNNLLEG